MVSLLKRFHVLSCACIVALIGCSQDASTSVPNETAEQAAVNRDLPEVATSVSGPEEAKAQTDPMPREDDPPPPPSQPPALSADDSGAASVEADPVSPSEPPTQDLSVDELIDGVQQAAQADDMQKAIVLAEQLAAKAPQHAARILLPQVYFARGRQLTEQGDGQTANPYFVKAAQAMRDIKKDRELSPREQQFLGFLVYGEASAYAAVNKKDEALASLKEAFESGFTEIDQARHDEGFASIRDSGEFTELLQNASKLIAERTRAATQEELSGFESFDFDFALTDLDDKPVKLADFQGKVLIVDFWGTWCPPCKAEIPHFIDLKQRYGDKGLAIVGINYEREPAELVKEKIRSFVADNGINYPCVIGDDATQQQVPDLTGYPTTLFIDRTGKVRMKLVGLQPLEKLESVVTALLAEGGGESGNL